MQVLDRAKASTFVRATASLYRRHWLTQGLERWQECHYAALEALMELEPPATTLQRHFRGYLCRHGTQRYAWMGAPELLGETSTVMARTVRGGLGRMRSRVLAAVREERRIFRAAASIQALHRAHAGREHTRALLRDMLRDTISAVCGGYMYKLLQLSILDDKDRGEAQRAVDLLHPREASARPREQGGRYARIVTQAELRSAVVSMLRIYGKSVMDTPQGRVRLKEQEHQLDPKPNLSVFHRSYPRIPVGDGGNASAQSSQSTHDRSPAVVAATGADNDEEVHGWKRVQGAVHSTRNVPKNWGYGLAAHSDVPPGKWAKCEVGDHMCPSYVMWDTYPACKECIATKEECKGGVLDVVRSAQPAVSAAAWVAALAAAEQEQDE